MDEAGFWSDRLRPALVKHCQALKLRHHFERVENAVAEGTPDVDYCIAGVSGKMELKFAPRHPVRDDSMVLGKGNGMRRSQIVYASRRAWAGGLIWCVIGTPAATWVIDLRRLTPEQMDGLATQTPAGLCQVAAWHSDQRVGSALPLALLAEHAKGRFSGLG